MAIHSKPLLNDQSFSTLKKLIHCHTGITIRPERKAMLEGRLSRRLRDLSLPDFESYIKYVESEPGEQEHFVNKVTTNETYFYRTPRIWEYISDTFLAQWHTENPRATLTAWSAASSTGEEAHTLGIVLQAYKDAHPGFDYRITGTDIDSSVVKSATEGLYKGRSIERFRQEKPELFSQYMKGSDTDGYKVSPSIKRNIQFSKLNLFKPRPVDTRYSLVLLRNVLIYFTREDTERVMEAVYHRLNQSGVVIIGESESLNNLTTNFTSIMPTVYKRSDAVARVRAA
ncbi:MAG: protein-glutamate O-methyltransferase CheR [Granulosicoccus sp.]